MSKNKFMNQDQLYPHQRMQGDLSLSFINIPDLFENKVKLTPDKDFLISPGDAKESFTYIDFFNKYISVAEYLNNLGLKNGDRINIIFANCPEFLLLYFAAFKLGITVVPINPDVSSSEFLYIILDCESKAVLYDRNLEFKLEEIKDKCESKTIIEAFDPLPYFKPLTDKNPSIDPQLFPKKELTDEAVIIYTSGTTGNPKGVILSYINLLSDAKAISDWFHFTPTTRTLCILPLFHNNGQVVTLLAPLFAGGSTVIVRGKASLIAFWGLVNKYKINWTSVMSSILNILLSMPLKRKDKSLVGIICGGQVLTRNVQDQFENQFEVPVFEGFGLTETTSFACFNEFPANKRKIGSIGKALPVNEISIQDAQGKEVAPNVEGEICIRGYNVANEYHNLPERNTLSFRDGWFHSGDFGYMDEEGCFYFKGRQDFLIIKGGENIYPAELENVLFKHPAIAEVAVIGIPDKLLGQDIAAFVKLNDSHETDEEALKEFCKGKIAAFKYPKEVIIIDQLDDVKEIPKGPTKKVLYGKLLELYLNIKPLKKEEYGR